MDRIGGCCLHYFLYTESLPSHYGGFRPSSNILSWRVGNSYRKARAVCAGGNVCLMAITALRVADMRCARYRRISNAEPTHGRPSPGGRMGGVSAVLRAQRPSVVGFQEVAHVGGTSKAPRVIVARHLPGDPDARRARLRCVIPYDATAYPLRKYAIPAY